MTSTFYIIHGKIISTGEHATHSLPENKLNDFIFLDKNSKIGVSINNIVTAIRKKDFNIKTIRIIRKI